MGTTASRAGPPQGRVARGLVEVDVAWGRLVTGVDVSYAAPQAHIIVNVELHREYSLGIVFIFFPREE
jgi:hypothetical protein